MQEETRLEHRKKVHFAVGMAELMVENRAHLQKNS